MNNKSETTVSFQNRAAILIATIITGLLGFCVWRYYSGFGEYWIRYYISGIVYVIFWCLFFFLLWPNKKNIFRIPIAVFIATCTLEFLQLWKPAFLQCFRSTPLGAALIGTCFVWLQFPFYVLGAAISVFLLAIFAKQK